MTNKSRRRKIKRILVSNVPHSVYKLMILNETKQQPTTKKMKNVFEINT